MTQRTFFGLEIISERGVRSSDIARLPFAAFWEASAARSAQVKDTASGEWLIYLRDWIAFSELFISTGQHRNMPRAPEVLWFDRDDKEPEPTYFGLAVHDQKYVLPQDIECLPFYDFWCEYAASKQLHPALAEATLIHLEDWSIFAKDFIAFGNSTLAANTNQNSRQQNMTTLKET